MGAVFIPIDKWIPQDITLETAALESVKSSKNILVIAGPGAGKTELLAQRACYLLQTNTCPYPKRILAVSFKKDAAANLAERIQKRCGKELASRFESMTFDSFAKELLDRFYQSLPIEYQPSKGYLVDTNNALLRKAFALSGIPNISINVKDPKPQIPKKVMKTMLQGDEKHDFQPALTFNLISRLTNYLLRSNPLIVEALRVTYSHVFLDEFQDTTSVQYDLVKTCFQGSNSVLTAVGDKKQRIMIWAGALSNAFEQFVADFSAEEKTMLMNHRSAPRLITLQKSLYEELNATNVDIKPNERWSPDDGIAELHYFSNQNDEAKYVIEKVKDYLVCNIKPRSICILVKRSIEEYAASLLGSDPYTGVNIRDEAIYQDLLKEDLTKVILAAVYCSLKADNPDAYTYLQDSDLTFKSVEPDDIEKVNAQILRLDTFLRTVSRAIESINEISQHDSFINLIENIVNYFGEKAIKDCFPQYQNGAYFGETKQKIVDLLWREYTEQLSWEKAIKSFEGEYSIPVMSIHKSKGLEFEKVFFLGLEDNAFFSYSTQKHEDTCAFFVAISRAISELHITMSENRHTLNHGAQKQTISNIKPFYKALNESKVVSVLDHRENLG